MAIVSGGSGSGFSPSFACVHRAATLDPWDGAALPFDVVDVDRDGLWDATNFQFVAKRGGWYQITAYPTSGSGGFTFLTSTTVVRAVALEAIVYGAGDNITLNLFAPVDAGGPHTVFFPSLVGVVNLAIADAVDIEGTNGWRVNGGFAFAIYGPLV